MKKVLHITSKSRIYKNGKFVSVEKEGETKEVAPENISLLVLDNGGIGLTSNILLYLTECGIPILIMNKKHDPEVFSYNLYSYYALTKNIKKQIKWENSSLINEITKEIIKKKIKHQKELLDYFCITKYREKIINLQNELEELKSFEDIIVIESQVAKYYFLSLFGNDFTRNEKDEINYALNYGYSILRSFIKVQIINKGLHPSIGIFHKNQFNNYNLADDIIEIYRPIVDYVVKILLEIDGTLCKEEKQKLLLVITQTVLLDNHKVSIEYATQKYIDSIINSFYENKLNLLIPHLEIGLYEY